MKNGGVGGRLYSSSSVWVDVDTIAGGVFFIFVLLTRRRTSTVIGSAAARNASTASS